MKLATFFSPIQMALAILCSSGFANPAPPVASIKKPVAIPATPDPVIVEFLLASAQKEFKSSSSNRPTAIRNARIGFLHEGPTGNYLLSGSFKSGHGATAKWTPFTTIKTSDYEHWLGGTAKAFSNRKNIKWYPEDYASTLMQRLKK
jgi:hypothetical protein